MDEWARAGCTSGRMQYRSMRAGHQKGKQGLPACLQHPAASCGCAGWRERSQWRQFTLWQGCGSSCTRQVPRETLPKHNMRVARSGGACKRPERSGATLPPPLFRPLPQDALMLGYSLILLSLIALGLALALLHWLLNADGMLWVQVRSASV